MNEKAARFVAGVVALTGITILATGWYWLLIPVTYGFWARVLTGPTLSPLARLAILRRSYASLCHAAGGELEQISFCSGVCQTSRPNGISAASSGSGGAVNDKIGIEPTR